MQKIKKQNQRHPPLPRKKRTDSLGNNYRDLLLKKRDGSTTTIAKGLTLEACNVLTQKINSALLSVKGKLEGNFIVIHGRKKKDV